MKATGIISRVDDLGRVRIPKELRRQLEIKEMDAIEFFIDGKNIVIRKYTFDNCERVIRPYKGNYKCPTCENYIYITDDDLERRLYRTGH